MKRPDKRRRHRGATANELVTPAEPQAVGALAEASDFLRAELSAGPRPTKDVRAAAKAAAHHLARVMGSPKGGRERTADLPASAFSF